MSLATKIDLIEDLEKYDMAIYYGENDKNTIIKDCDILCECANSDFVGTTLAAHITIYTSINNVSLDDLNKYINHLNSIDEDFHHNTMFFIEKESVQLHYIGNESKLIELYELFLSIKFDKFLDDINYIDETYYKYNTKSPENNNNSDNNDNDNNFDDNDNSDCDVIDDELNETAKQLSGNNK